MTESLDTEYRLQMCRNAELVESAIIPIVWWAQHDSHVDLMVKREYSYYTGILDRGKRPWVRAAAQSSAYWHWNVMTTRTRAAFLTLIFNIWILCLVERIGTHWLLWDSNTLSALLNDCVANSEVWDCTETVVHMVWWYHELWVEPNAFSPSLDLDEMWRESKCHKRNWEISREKGIKSLMYHCTWGQRIRKHCDATQCVRSNICSET